MEVPEQLMQSFKSRKDNQIMGLEILSIALGVHGRVLLSHRRGLTVVYVQASAVLPI